MKKSIIEKTIIKLGFVATLIFGITAMIMAKNDNDACITFLIAATTIAVITDSLITRVGKQSQQTIN